VSHPKRSPRRRLGPGLYAVLDFHATRLYGRRLEQLAPEERLAVARLVLGENAQLVEEIIAGKNKSGEDTAGITPAKPLRLHLLARI
jgi:hypothetical protein